MPKTKTDVLVEQDGMTLYKGIKEGGRAMFLRVHCGNAVSSEGVEYELTQSAANGAPLITNKANGRTVAFSWVGLIEAARRIGIDG